MEQIIGGGQNHLKTGGEHVEFKGKVSGTHDISPKCSEVFLEMKIRRKHRFIIFKIGDDAIEVDSIGERNQTFDDMKKSLPFTDCRYAIFDHEFKTHDGRPTSKLWFISWFPNNSTPYIKMAYTSAKTKFRDTLPGIFDASASNIEELDGIVGANKEDSDNDEDFDF